MTAPTPAQIEAAIEKRLRRALEPFAAIEVPPNADDGTWVAKTIYCNNQVTARSVNEAKAALTAAAEVGEPPLKCPRCGMFKCYCNTPAAAEVGGRVPLSQIMLDEARAEERERCARVADEIALIHCHPVGSSGAELAAAAIRAEKDKP